MRKGGLQGRVVERGRGGFRAPKGGLQKGGGESASERGAFRGAFRGALRGALRGPVSASEIPRRVFVHIECKCLGF